MALITAPFSTGPADQAAAAQVAALQQAGNLYGDIIGDFALPALTGGYNAAEGTVNSLYGNAILNYGAPMATNAINAFGNNVQAGDQGVKAYGDATGANGPGGTQQALTSFWSNPGITSQLQQAQAAIAGGAARGGTTASGNELQALQQQGIGLVGTNYQNYVNNLVPYLNFSTTNTAGQSAAGLTGANLLSGLNTQQATTLSGLQAALGTQQAGAQTNLANMFYGDITSQGNANANAQLAAYGAGANQLAALTGLLGLGSSSLGASGAFGQGAGGGALAGLLA
jgi:hypothetical protein